MAILKRKSQSLVSKINNKLIIHVKRVRLLEIEAVPFCIMQDISQAGRC